MATLLSSQHTATQKCKRPRRTTQTWGQAPRQSQENREGAEAPSFASAAALGLSSRGDSSGPGRRRPGPRPRLPQDAPAARGSHGRPRSSRSLPCPPLTQFCALLLSLTFLHRLPGISMAAKRGLSSSRAPGSGAGGERPGAGRSWERGGACSPGPRARADVLSDY